MAAKAPLKKHGSKSGSQEMLPEESSGSLKGDSLMGSSQATNDSSKGGAGDLMASMGSLLGTSSGSGGGGGTGRAARKKAAQEEAARLEALRIAEEEARRKAEEEEAARIAREAAERIRNRVLSASSTAYLIAGGFRHSCLIQEDGSLVCFGTSGRSQCEVPPDLGGPFVAVAAGNFHNCAVQADGQLKCFGDNSFGQCSVPQNLRAIKQVAAGYSHTVALDDKGKLISFGDSTYGQCMIPDSLAPIISIAAGFKHTVLLQRTGKIVCFGDNSEEQCEIPEDLGPVKAIAAGDFHTCVIQDDGKLVCWGSNASGQCDVPPDLGPVKAVAAGSKHTLVATVDDTLWGFGADGHGQCSVPEHLRASVYVEPLAPQLLTLEPFDRDDEYYDAKHLFSIGLGPDPDAPPEEESAAESMEESPTASDSLALGSIPGSKEWPSQDSVGSTSPASPQSPDASQRPASTDSPTSGKSKKTRAKEKPDTPVDSRGSSKSGMSQEGSTEDLGSTIGKQKKSGKKKKTQGDPNLGASEQSISEETPSILADPEPIIAEEVVEDKGPCRPQVMSLAAGSFHSLALLSDGSLIVFGDDSAEQIKAPEGLKPTLPKVDPPALEGLEP
eukprot:TRINITY_DN12991_c3_g1_i1.p1 TRINITY_DN12991_c3_g1~~TRINITY_DN12991_c3_g1_i1.p1  ORF type:complete len:613 (+),score=131.06 TRINITY_DN12991_c3_g1_i1:135-1973(+)